MRDGSLGYCTLSLTAHSGRFSAHGLESRVEVCSYSVCLHARKGSLSERVVVATAVKSLSIVRWDRFS